MDFGRAISYIRQDPNWIVKVLLGSVLSLVPILNFVVYGYSMDVIRNVYYGRETPLPEWGENFGERWVKGLLYFVVALIYSLPAFVLLVIWSVVFSGIAAMSNGEDIGGGGVAALCILPFIIVAFLLLGLLAQVAIARYAISGNFSDAMSFGAVFAEFQRSIGKWIYVIVLMIIVGFVYGLIAGITCGLAFLMAFYVTLIQSHLMAQAYREANQGTITEPGRL